MTPLDDPSRDAPWTTGQMAQRLGAELIGPDDLPLRALNTIDAADEQTLTFIRDAKYASSWSRSRAGAAIVSRGIEVPGHDPARRALLIVDDADHALIGVLETLAPRHAAPTGVHPTAVIDSTATIGQGVAIGAHTVVGAGSAVGDNTVLHANVSIGAGVRIGAACDIRAGAVVEDRCVIGDHVILHPNVVIGADGFGYRPSPDGKGLIKIPHAGIVEIHDHAEIGAGATIDRGKFGATVVGAGTKIDNLVQIGHNCRIGRSCVICGCAALAGSVTVEDGVTLGGGVGIRDNVTIGAGAKVGARSGVMENIPPGESWVGYPAKPHHVTMRVVAATQKLPDTMRELRSMLRAMKAEQEQV